MRHGLSFDNWNDSDGVFGRSNVKFCGFFLPSTTSNCFILFLRINFAVGQTNRVDVNAPPVSASMNVDGYVQQSMLQSNTSCRALFYANFFRSCSTKLKNAVFKPSFAESKPMVNASKSYSAPAFKIVSFSLLL